MAKLNTREVILTIKLASTLRPAPRVRALGGRPLRWRRGSPHRSSSSIRVSDLENQNDVGHTGLPVSPPPGHFDWFPRAIVSFQSDCL